MMNAKEWAEFMSKQLDELSNSEYQSRIWIQGKGPEVSSFDEAINLFFEHYDGFLDLLEIASDKSLCSSLNAVYLALKSITDDVMDDKKMNESFLMSPVWQNVIDLAKKAKENLDSKRIDWSNRSIM